MVFTQSPPALAPQPDGVHRLGRLDWNIAALLFLLALATRLYRLFELDVWFDEVAILFQAQMSFAEIWNLCKTENFPPLYSWLVKIWSWPSAADGWARLFSALIGALIPPALFLTGRELHDRRLGILMGIAGLLSPPLYFYSQNIRMYGLYVLLACLSYLGFLRALKTNEWKYWWLMAISNLLGFYTFLFMAFAILSEGLILLARYRFNVRSYLRPALSHLPALAIMSLWIIPMLQRFGAMQAYMSKNLELVDLLNLGIYFGTGLKYPHQYLLTAFLNLPFLLGILLGIRHWAKAKFMLTAVSLSAVSLAVIGGISLLQYSIFFDRYLLFLLPLFLALAFFGWLRLARPLWRHLGLAWVFLALLYSQGYYQKNYVLVNDIYRYHFIFTSPEDDDGRSFSRMAARVKERLGNDEVIVHYPEHSLSTFSFFTFVHYHKRLLPEYFYAAEELPQYGGRQYVQPGDWIRTLDDLKPPPSGIWVITLSDPGFVLFDSESYRNVKRFLIGEADLAKDLFDLDYRHLETIRDGAVSAVHLRRKS